MAIVILAIMVLDLMTLNWKFSFNQAAKCFVHKGSLGLLFFCIYFVILYRYELNSLELVISSKKIKENV